MSEYWNTRYNNEAFAYGETPNLFFKAQLEPLTPGKILLPADGEGRNGVFAATLGWEVSAFDLSEAGKKKAELLAAKNGVALDYQVGEFSELQYAPEQFDVIALIYAHFSGDTKSGYHKILNGYLRKGGIVIFEAFSKKHLAYNSSNPKVGGPKDLDTLFSIEEIQHDFDNYEVMELIETEIELEEGLFHIGKGSVIRFVGRKR
jgi:hypothetical protein